MGELAGYAAAMKTAAAWHAGTASDPGLRRRVNEDRVLSDDARGVFLVVDGLGGHAAGETAAETAVRIIEEQMHLLDPEGDPEPAIRRAITEANNRIYELACSHSEWQGMACVLTLAVAQEERITVGHVGDSRLYLIWNGQLRKLTSDHSPVGELEDQGTLTEEEAMQHPRRNEVFRDVGSRPRAADEAQFIDIKRFPFHSDAALLLCSDGLSDVLTSAEISAVIERYNADPDKTAQQLVEAANAAGGKDNISVVFVPGPEFLGSQSQTLREARPRHAITRLRGDERNWRSVLRNAIWLVAGMVLGIALWVAVERWAPRPAQSQAQTSVFRLRPPIVVSAADSHGIQRALETALPGDTVEIPPGDYLGPLELKNAVNVVGAGPAQVTLRSDPAYISNAASEAGIAIVARSLRAGRVEGIRIAADDTHPLRAGIWISDATVEVANVDISGAIEAGIRIEGAAEPILLANFIHANSGPGVVIKNHSAPRLTGNWISENGRIAHALRPGVEVDLGARPRFGRNVIVRNGVAGDLSEDPAHERSK